MAESGTWILKIISGPHQGAETSLSPGRLVVGSDAECDLVLHDVLVAPRHFALSLDQTTVTVESLEGPVFCNGKRVTAATPVPPFGFVTLGTTHLVLGPSAARWPLLSLADVPELEKEPVAAPVAAVEKPDASTADDASKSTDKKTLKPPTRDQRRRALWTAGIGGALLIVWLVLWFVWTPHTTLAPSASVRERAEATLRAFPDAKSITLEQQGDRLVAAGYVESESAQREITTAFRDDLPEVTLRIWSTARIVETARTFLAQRNLPLEVAIGDPGELRVRGNVRSPDDWKRMRQLLLAEIPGLQRVRDEITFPAAAVATRPPAANPITSTPSSLSAPAAENISVVALQELADGQGWLRLSNGAVLFRGGQLSGGGRVITFRQGRALIEDGDARFALGVGMELAAARRTPLPAELAPETTLADTPQVAAKKTSPPNG